MNSKKLAVLLVLSISIIESVSYAAGKNKQADNRQSPRLSPIEAIEYKNSHYIYPSVAACTGHMIRIPFQAPGKITKVELFRQEGRGCGWTWQCPDGTCCPEPYRYPVAYSGDRAWWQGWSNSGENCALRLRVYWDTSTDASRLKQRPK